MSTRTESDGWRPRFGKSRVIDVLVGSRRAEVVERGLDRLSTHGILKAEGAGYLKALFVEMERAGLIGRTEGEYPLVELTSAGETVMRNRTAASLSWPDRRRRDRTREASRSPVADTVPEYDEVLFEALRKCRRNLSMDGGNLPAYTIFNDRTLKEMASIMPLNVDDALKVSGIGAVKARRWFHHFQPLIAAHAAEKENGNVSGNNLGGEAIFT